MSRALIYTKNACPFCISAKQLLDSRGISYEEVNIEEGENRNLLFEVLPHARSVPQIFLDNEYVGGFAQLRERFLDNDPRQLLNE